MATKTQRARIVADSNPCNPRTEWDCHSGRMICWHRRYNLGDKHDYDDPDNFMYELAFEAHEGLEDRVHQLENEVFDRLYNRAVDAGRDDPFKWANSLVSTKVSNLVESAVRGGYVILPLYLYDHSGISMSTGPFSCPCDSGQVGYIICDDGTIQNDFKGDRDLAEKALQAEVEVYDQYLTGDVYGFIVEERDTEDDLWEHVDSCCGFFGSDVRMNGMAEHLGSDDLVELAACADVEYPMY